jgi:hypothetical protein
MQLRSPEMWKSLPINNLYEVSTNGNIRNAKNLKQKVFDIDKLKLTKTRIRVNNIVNENGDKRGFYLHRLIAMTFIPNPLNLDEVNHKNGDPYDNRIENLEWISRADNMKHFHENNKFSKKYMRKLLCINKDTGTIETTYKCIDDYLETTKDDIRYGKLYNILNSKYNNNNGEDGSYDLGNNKILKFEKTIVLEPVNTECCWKPISEAPLYEVSNTGLVKHLRLNRIVKGYLINGYKSVNLKLSETSDKKICRLVHRLVAAEFIPNEFLERIYVDHIDTNPLNNDVTNLRWVTPKENMNNPLTKQNISLALLGHSSKILQIDITTGDIVGEYMNNDDFQSQDTDNSNTVMNYDTITKIANFYKNGNTIVKVGHQKTYHKKYIFIYENNIDMKDKYIEIANMNNNITGTKIVQIDKNTLEIINKFDSMYDASKQLGINYGGICQVYNYHKYTDETRPACYKLKTTHGFIFKDL